MARNDIKILEPIEPKFSTRWAVAAGTASSIKAGEPVYVDGINFGTVKIMVDAMGTTGSRFAGIAKSDSTDTAAAAGVVDVWLPLPGMVYAAKAKTAANADTDAEITALQGKRVIFDLTSSTWTVDTGATETPTNCVTIIGGDSASSTIYFTYNIAGTILACTVV